MKFIKFIILCLIMSSCTSQKQVLSNEIEISYKKYVINKYEDETTQKRLNLILKNGELVNRRRKVFFEKVDKKVIKNGNLIENINQFRDNYYNATLELDNYIYIYKSSLSGETLDFKVMTLDEFNNGNYYPELCILKRMKSDNMGDLLDDKITTRFHSTFYTTKIRSKNDIEFHILIDICND